MTELTPAQISRVGGGMAMPCLKKHWEKIIPLPLVAPPRIVQPIAPVLA